MNTFACNMLSYILNEDQAGTLWYLIAHTVISVHSLNLSYNHKMSKLLPRGVIPEEIKFKSCAYNSVNHSFNLQSKDI